MSRSSGRKCSICTNPAIDAINVYIPGHSLRDIAGRFNLTKSSIARHLANIARHQANCGQPARLAEPETLPAQMLPAQPAAPKPFEPKPLMPGRLTINRPPSSVIASIKSRQLPRVGLLNLKPKPLVFAPIKKAEQKD